MARVPRVPRPDAPAARFGLKGVWMAYPIAFVAMLPLQAAYYHVCWRKRKIVRLV